MKLHLDQATDALYLRIAEAPAVESEETAPGVVLDFDAEGNVAGIEVLNLSKRGAPLTEVEIGTTAA
jgi:uncharacterized protein YuzE